MGGRLLRLLDLAPVPSLVDGLITSMPKAGEGRSKSKSITDGLSGGPALGGDELVRKSSSCCCRCAAIVDDAASGGDLTGAASFAFRFLNILLISCLACSYCCTCVTRKAWIVQSTRLTST